MDLKALNHILMNGSVYQKPEFFRYHLGQIVGQGLLVVEDEVHKNHVSPRQPALILQRLLIPYVRQCSAES